MEKQNIYHDISARTGGEIYLGVVGPVRSGKSTFIKRFMELLVLPAIKDENERKRTMDELPQSGTGKIVRQRNQNSFQKKQRNCRWKIENKNPFD